MIRLARARIGLVYWWRHRRWPDLDRPRRFTEWVQWRKIHDRDPARALLTDKAHSKSFAAAVLGDEFTIPTLWEGQELPDTAPWPMPFVVKSNHGCGQVAIIRSVRDYEQVRSLAKGWLKRAYGVWLDEWHYREARRSLLVESYVGPSDMLPIDYKIYVFGGRAVMIQVHEGRGVRHRWSQYATDWSRLSDAGTASAPRSLVTMLAAAERLARDHDFLRVDFYESGGVPLFGEFCLYPGSGLDPFSPAGLDDWLGAQWSAQQPLHSPDAVRGTLRVTEIEAN